MISRAPPEFSGALTDAGALSGRIVQRRVVSAKAGESIVLRLHPVAGSAAAVAWASGACWAADGVTKFDVAQARPPPALARIDIERIAEPRARKQSGGEEAGGVGGSGKPVGGGGGGGKPIGCSRPVQVSPFLLNAVRTRVQTTANAPTTLEDGWRPRTREDAAADAEPATATPPPGESSASSASAASAAAAAPTHADADGAATEFVQYSFGGSSVVSSEKIRSSGNNYAVDLSFAGLGHVSLSCADAFKITVHGLAGASSNFRPPLYPKVRCHIPLISLQSPSNLHPISLRSHST